MNKESAAEYLPLVQALAEGKQIEHREGISCWVVCPNPQFDDEPSEYRVKVEIVPAREVLP